MERTPPHHQIDPDLLRFRLLRQANDGQWWAVSGDGCGADAVHKDYVRDRAELLWSATGIRTGSMEKRENAVQKNTDLYFPIHYHRESIENLRHPTDTDPRFPAFPLKAQGADGQQWYGFERYTDVVERAQAPKWRASGALARWLQHLHIQAQSPACVYGPGATPLGKPTHTTAHTHCNSRYIAQNLRPLSRDTYLVWIGTEAGFFLPRSTTDPKMDQISN